LVEGDFGEAFDFLGDGPLYFDEVDDGGFAEAEVEAEVGLKNDARPGVDFVHLDVSNRKECEDP